jgi:hypothetical protein
MPSPIMDWRRARLLVALFVFTASVYLIVYSARSESGDTRRFFDAVSSLADYGDFDLDQSAFLFPPQDFDARVALPLQRADVEPLQVVLATPLYLLARAIPGLGLVQTVYLFNVIVGALAACVLFVYALALGARETTAALAALMLGVGTALFPYTKSFFREPLVLLALLSCGLMLERLRASRYRSVPLLMGAALASGAVVLAKASALLALPALLVIALPDVRTVLSRRALIILAVVLALALVGFGVMSAVSAFGERYNLLHQLRDASGSYLLTALQAYLLSVGGSIWGTSPMTLLALPGIVLLLRQGRPRYALVVVLMLLAFAVGYAALNGVHWFGGLSWPPRFLIPVLPFLILGALPAIDRVTRSPAWAFLGAALLVYSLWVQLSGVTLDWGVYSAALPPQADGLIEWGPGLNDPRYLRWVLIPTLWNAIPLDIAWSVIDARGVMLAFAALAAAAGAWLLRGLRRGMRRAVFVLPVALVVLVGFGLRLLYENDPRYLARDDSLKAMLPILEAQTNPGDLILLSSPRYEPFFANAGKLTEAGRVITLPLQPGEQSSDVQEPQVRSDNPDALLTKPTIQLLYNLAATHERLWLLVDGGPDLPWSVRPVERFMDAHFYRVGSPIQTSPITRLIEYSTASAPDMFAYRQPERTSALVFGDHISLLGFELPQGTEIHAGGVLALSLYWQTDAPLAGNYTVGVYLRDANGAPVAQTDGQPGGEFFPTSSWQPGVPVWDNRGVRLPDALAAGRYQVWLKVYDFGADGAVRDLPVTAGDKADAAIGVLPVTLDVTN